MTGVIILAAGESSRLGQPKQNLVFNGQTLLQHAVAGAQESQCQPVIVVLGANADAIVIPKNVTILYNQEWKEGMASSIKIAVNEISKDASIDKVIIMLCDQPFVNAELLNTMIIKQAETGKPIIACTYGNTVGVPVLFDGSLFTELLSLQGQEGAKKILNLHANEVATVPFEGGSIDIDTLPDFEKLSNWNN